MSVFIFRRGYRNFVGTDSADDDAEIIRPYAGNFVATELIVRPAKKKVLTHSLAHRERLEPETTFIAVVAAEEYYRRVRAATADYRKMQAELRRTIRKLKPLVSKRVRWKDLSPELKARCHGSNLASNECWLWLPSEKRSRKSTANRWNDVAPYRQFYIKLKGPIPKGVVLRHKCDNALCMNPNHLQLGTYKDNARDREKRQGKPNPLVSWDRLKDREVQLRSEERRKKIRPVMQRSTRADSSNVERGR